mmetsp:Transcript_22426/g.54799  ORF Transcript_22426/g.54799 Transcript_22426/m.54799 type:complete len:349 (+) Transcript_22426:14-1060(+)
MAVPASPVPGVWRLVEPPVTNETDVTALGYRLTSYTYAQVLLQVRYVGFIVLIPLVLAVGMLLHRLPYYAQSFIGDNARLRTGVKHLLVEDDNKAFAMSLAGYIVAVGMVARGAVSAGNYYFGEGILINEAEAFGFACAWAAIGLAMLFLCHTVGRALLSSRVFFDSGNAVFDGNTAIGFLEGGYYIASGLIIMNTALSARVVAFEENVYAALLYFALGQICLLLFTKVYQYTTRYDDIEELAAANVAAGVGYALTIIAIGQLIANPVGKSHSALAFTLSFLLGTTLLALTRLLVDILFLPGRLLDKEIAIDKNWGAALLEGTVAIVVGLVWSTFLADSTPPDAFIVC